uniref:Uncharacterized protein n=1 Tax=Callorhinchus milii TaxID=7868 RepID=A0A4W3ICM3_CALMI
MCLLQDQVKSSLASLAQMKETALQAEAKQNQNISQLKEQASSLQTQVKNDFAKIHQILTDREQRVMIDLRQREEEILQRMETNLREIRSNLDSVQQEISELQTQMKRDGPIFLQEEAARKKRYEMIFTKYLRNCCTNKHNVRFYIIMKNSYHQPLS